MYRTALALVTLLPSVALASAPQLDISWPNVRSFQDPGGDAAASGSARESSTGRKFDMEVNFRGRYVWVPRSIIDIWYFNENDAGWADSRPRPFMQGYELGLEFVVKGDNANGIFYVDWIESMMKAGYWDDKESPPNHQDGEFIVPTPTLGILNFGADYAYEAYFVRTSDTNGAFGLSMVVGGGLGVGFLIGQLERWTVGPNGTPAYIRYDNRYDNGVAFDDYKQIPKVYPMVDINLGLRFNFADRVMLRIEGGLHTLLYGGATLGIMF